MICNRCVKQDVCVNKYMTEQVEAMIAAEKIFSHIELDCKHREQATQEQLNRMKEKEE